MLVLLLITCKSPFTPIDSITEIDIVVKYERVYQTDSSGYNWVFIEIEIRTPEPNYFYKSVRLEEESDGTYIGTVGNVPTGSKFAAYVDDRMVFPLSQPGESVKGIGRRIFMNGHECKSIEGSYGSERIRGSISKSGQITDD